MSIIWNKEIDILPMNMLDYTIHSLSIVDHDNKVSLMFNILYISRLLTVVAHIIDSDSNVVATFTGEDMNDVNGYITDWALAYDSAISST
jgi:hypothetical protein